MLILPIIYKDKVINVEVKLKKANLIRKGVSFSDALAGDIIINSEKFSKSGYKDKMASVKFIRSRLAQRPRDFLVTTKEVSNGSVYDVYQIAPPPKKVNDSLDMLYDSAINDLRCMIPNLKKRGRYVSLEKLGFNDILTDEKLTKLRRVVSEFDKEMWPKVFSDEGVIELKEMIGFIKNFDCTVVSDGMIKLESLSDTIKTLSVINTRDYRNINNYYEMAKSNTNIYTKLAYINKVIYGKPLSLIQLKDYKTKQLVKE